MTYEVLARKWRPQQFKDVIGQEHVTRTLENAIRAQRVAHAYLFVGGRGIGKTTTARILAKALNCQTGSTPTPCDQCDSCREIVAGIHLDVLEIDGASNNSVEQVRELRERAAYTPARGPYKIYIIDEVHMLSNSAFNALLKLLEEPPPHVKFMFATTEPHKVPGTILSRCQRFDLRPIPLREIVAHLGRIGEAEGVTIAQDALLAIARGAEGGMRDAESALDQLIAFCGGEITEADVMSVFGLVARRELEALAEALLRGDVPTTLRQVTVLDQAGKDMARVVEEILGHLRNLLLVLHAGAGAAELDLTEAQVEVLQEQARETTPPRVLRMAEILTLAQERMRQAPSKRTVIELGLIQAAQAATQVDLDQLLERMAMLRRELAGTAPAAGAVAVRPSPPPPPPAPAPAPPASDRTVREAAPAAMAPPQAAPAADEVARLNAAWRELVAEVGKSAPLARQALLDAKPVGTGPAEVALGLDPEFATHRETLEIPRNQKALNQALSRFLKRDVRVRLSLLEAGATVPADAAADSQRSVMSRDAAQQWSADPAVKSILEAFDGDITDIRA